MMLISKVGDDNSFSKILRVSKVFERGKIINFITFFKVIFLE
jgi:hypothetical protein